MSANILRCEVEREHYDNANMTGRVACFPGVEIVVSFHPESRVSAAKALTEAYEHVLASIKAGDSDA